MVSRVVARVVSLADKVMDFIGVAGFRAAGRYREAHLQMARAVHDVIEVIQHHDPDQTTLAFDRLHDASRALASRGVSAEKLERLLVKQVRWQLGQDKANVGVQAPQIELVRLESVLQTQMAVVDAMQESASSGVAKRRGAVVCDALYLGRGVKALMTTLVDVCERHALEAPVSSRGAVEITPEFAVREREAWEALNSKFSSREYKQRLLSATDDLAVMYQETETVFVSLYGQSANEMISKSERHSIFLSRGLQADTPLDLRERILRGMSQDANQKAEHAQRLTLAEKCKTWEVAGEAHASELERIRQASKENAARVSRQRLDVLRKKATEQIDHELQQLEAERKPWETHESFGRHVLGVIDMAIIEADAKKEQLAEKSSGKGLAGGFKRVFGSDPQREKKFGEYLAMKPEYLEALGNSNLLATDKNSPSFAPWLGALRQRDPLLFSFLDSSLALSKNVTREALLRLKSHVTDDIRHNKQKKDAFRSNPLVATPKDRLIAQRASALQAEVQTDWASRRSEVQKWRKLLTDVHVIFSRMLRSSVHGEVPTSINFDSAYQLSDEVLDNDESRRGICSRLKLSPQTRVGGIGFTAMSLDEAVAHQQQYLYKLEEDLARLGEEDVAQSVIDQMRATWAQLDTPIP
ncbi:hypothetical protein PIN31115_04471 [Pandoraea iniqua]|uniref:Uncharacterized protein n=2 Tax=Pandoraea iniqua TaxID=2508288 RepID=A0A5E4YGE7_9BURK|nr:hypothetical protein PIN31115_04471 [Pandoraea iniqua]